jgi:hypothetical protein
MPTHISELTELDLIKLIATSSFAGGVLGAIITASVNYVLSKRNFKFKSYEEIVKKRFIAYDKISKVSMRLNVYIREADDTVINEVFVNGIRYFEDFQIVILDAFTDSFWLDQKTGDLLSQLGVKFSNWTAEAQATSDANLALIQISIRDKSLIKSLADSISQQLRHELINLHEVEAFVNRKVKRNIKYPIIKYH